MVDGAVFLAIERDAAQKYINAGMSGSNGDGGASVLREQVKYYKYGRDGILPPEWEPYQLQALRESDPDWAELQRLKKKFGER